MIQIPLLAGPLRTPAKRHLNDVSLACRFWPKIESWLCSFTILRAPGPVLLKKLYFWEF